MLLIMVSIIIRIVMIMIMISIIIIISSSSSSSSISVSIGMIHIIAMMIRVHDSKTVVRSLTDDIGPEESRPERSGRRRAKGNPLCPRLSVRRRSP